MDLYLIRHAEAAPAGEGGVTRDEDRPLTPRGIERAHALADAFRREGIELAALVTSPLVRARQTAEEIVRSWPAPAPEIIPSDHLAPGGRRKKLARQLRELGDRPVALVGHEPDIGWLAGWLIGGRKAQVRLAKAGVACLQCESEPDKGACTLVWLATPEMLRR